MITLRLSWPSHALSANARVHWRVKARAVKAARMEAWALAGAMSVGRWPTATLRFRWHPPDNRRRDASNLPHMVKAAIDGIALAMGCDDEHFRCVFDPLLSAPVAGGVVVVEIEP